MFCKKKSPTANKHGEDTAKEILKVATKLFGEKGFDGVSTKEICDKAKANISSLHYHFETKENLFYSVIKQSGEPFLASTTRILTPPQTLDEMKIRLELFLIETLTHYIENKDLQHIIYRELGYKTERSQMLFKLFIPVIETVKNFFNEAQKNKILKEDCDSTFAAFVFLKQFQPEFDTQGFKNKYFDLDLETPEGRKKFIQKSLQHFLNGIV